MSLKMRNEVFSYKGCKVSTDKKYLGNDGCVAKILLKGGKSIQVKGATFFDCKKKAIAVIEQSLFKNGKNEQGKEP